MLKPLNGAIKATARDRGHKLTGDNLCQGKNGEARVQKAQPDTTAAYRQKIQERGEYTNTGRTIEDLLDLVEHIGDVALVAPQRQPLSLHTLEGIKENGMANLLATDTALKPASTKSKRLPTDAFRRQPD